MEGRELVRIYIFLLLLFTLLRADEVESFSDMTSSALKSIGEKIEIGVDYQFFSSLKVQDKLLADSSYRDFQESNSPMPSIYISLKSKSYLTPIDVGFYFNSTLRYFNIAKQRPLFSDGAVYDKEADIETSIHYISFDVTPSLFYFVDFGSSKLVLELFGGTGISTYFGKYREYLSPTYKEFNSTEDKSIFQVSDSGEIYYIGDVEDVGMNFGIDLLYGVKLKYIYKDFNIHLLYQSPIVWTTDKYLNITQISIGVGYSI